jgi:hypothetical protein
MDDLLLELRQAARRLRRGSVIAGLTVLTLGLGIGIVTAAFALVEAVLLRPSSPTRIGWSGSGRRT